MKAPKGQLPPGPLPKGASATTTTVSASAAITERLDAKAREAKLLREVFETFAKTVDTFVASCKDDKRPIAHQISSQVVNFISTTYFASTDGNDFVPIRARRKASTRKIVDTDNVRESLLTDKYKVFASNSQKTRLGFIFTGQGAQWHAMGEGLFQYAVFKNTILYLDQALAQLPNFSGDWKLQDVLTGNCASDLINVPLVSQTVCIALQVGLVDLLRSWKVEPVAVAGHSSGEIAAAYAARRITAVDAIITAYCRYQGISHNPKEGLMLAVGLELDAVEKYLSKFEMKVRVAAFNSPISLTLSGDKDAIKVVSERMNEDALGEECERMLTEGLEHTRRLGIIEPQSQSPAVSWFSSVVPHERMDMVKINASYWRSNVESPVCFWEATSQLAQKVDAIIEIGPHAALKGPIGQIMKSIGVDTPYISALRRGEDGQLCLLQLVGTLFGLNAGIDLAAVNSTDRVQANRSLSYVHGCMAIDLPPYQYTYGPIQYYESRISKEIRSRTTLRHDLLGSKLPGNAKLNPQWRNFLRLKDLPWMGDHRLLPHPVFPGAGYLMMAVEAASQAYIQDFSEPLSITGFSLQNVSIKSAMRIPEDDYGVEVLLSLQLLESTTAKKPSWISFSIRSVADVPLNTAANSSAAFSAPIFRLTWKPDIRSMSNAQAKVLFYPPSDSIAKTRSDLSHRSEHIRNFLFWAQRQTNNYNEWVVEAKGLTSAERLLCIDQIYEQIDHCADARVARHMFQNIEDVLYERKTGMDVLAQDGLLTAMYEEGIILAGAYPQVRRCFDAIGHATPSLDIIEIGAGTGGATRIILDTLSERDGIKRYKSYTFTNISSGLVGAAKEMLGEEYNDVHFSVLNVEQDPLENGCQPFYDVVVASDCLHATTNISQTLSNCRKLLKPGGRLIIVENTRTVIGHGLILGTLTGYWSGRSDGRVDSPFLDSSGWNASLLANGFSGTDLVLDDYPQPYTTACTFLSTVVEGTISTVPRQLTDLNSEEVYFLHEQRDPSSLAVQTFAHFKEKGFVVKSCSFDVVTVPPHSRVIAFLDSDNHLIQIDQHRMEKFQSLFRNASSMILVTYGGIIQGKNPSAAISIGLLRTIGTENPTSRFLSIDVNPDSPTGTLAGTILKLESSLQTPSSLYYGDDNEFVWQDECLWVSRLVPDPGLKDQLELAELPPARAKPLCFDNHGPVRADFETPGLLTSLYFKPCEDMWKPLPDDWVEIKVAAVGLNWKDLAISAGRFDMNTLSSEYSGIVYRVGSAVTNISVGDRVYGLGKGHFGNYVRVHAATAQHLHPEDDLLKMATMPLVYMTVVYGFSYATKLKRGEKLLIQSATGGLGMAAIQLAQSIGAEVFATVGTADKAKYLAEVFRIPASRIFSSRATADFPKMTDATGGRGFNVILSTSQGDMLHESIKALAPLGRIIDVGRVDVQNSMTLNLALFQKSATFSSFDLGVIVEAQPEMSQILMQSVDEHFRAGNIAPIPAILASNVSELDQTLLGFSKGTHIGKLVVNFQTPDSLVKMVPPVP
ncbi:polyketide synthase dehydratase-domain-containing protein [Penicillium digitatum]|uniref:Polyketide synthase dehydratase-domain-containing protein n=1 Tax=Penicillium digitatum TaxID=36651 RepID=A0A7T7BKB8_PENDI|nr:polyketide synthase dehydratase-domain-containing protein [Penicillium digitatum]